MGLVEPCRKCAHRETCDAKAKEDCRFVLKGFTYYENFEPDEVDD